MSPPPRPPTCHPPTPMSPTATAIRMGQRMIHHTAAFSFLSQHLHMGTRLSGVPNTIGDSGVPNMGQNGEGGWGDSPLVLVEVTHHHPRHHEEHGGSCGVRLGARGWGRGGGDGDMELGNWEQGWGHGVGLGSWGWGWG